MSRSYLTPALLKRVKLAMDHESYGGIHVDHITATARAALEEANFSGLCAALSECEDKLFVLSFSLRDEAERQAALTACNMASAALRRAGAR